MTYDVLIAGAGPVGLSLSALLSGQGISNLVVERRTGLHEHPQAHVIATRTMEVFREIGIADQVASAAAPLEKVAGINWAESVAGLSIGRLDLTTDQQGLVRRLAASPVFTANLAQHLLEPILLDAATQSAEVHFNSELIDLDEGEEGVTATVRQNGSDSQVHARYVVGCDGAGSRVRALTGIEMDGPASLDEFVGLQFEADLSAYLEGRSGPLFWIHADGFRATLIGYDIQSCWVLMVSRSAFADPDNIAEQDCKAFIQKALGHDNIPFIFMAANHWNMSAQVAQTYARGRVFIAGDAAHRFPPTGGLGMNSGIQDAHNLAWKLALVIKGVADQSLLTTYEQERRPIARTYTDHSVQNAGDIFKVSEALGEFEVPSQIGARLACLRAGGPEAIALQARIDQAIEDQRAHYSFLGLDLGYIYRTGALVADPDRDLPDMVHDREAATDYNGDLLVGGRFPHLTVMRDGAHGTSLDLVGRGRFTVIIAESHAEQMAAVKEAFAQSDLPIDYVTVGSGGTIEIVDTGLPVNLATQTLLLSGRAVVVRPDGFVGFISDQSGQSLVDQVQEAIAFMAQNSRSVPLQECGE